MYGLRWVQEPSTASFGVNSQWESSGCCVPRAVRVEDPGREPQRSHDLSRGDVSVNTRKCGGKGKRGACPYGIEDIKNKGTEK